MGIPGQITVLAPAARDLRTHWKAGMALALAGAAAVIATLPVTTLMGPGFLPRLGIAPGTRNMAWLDWSPRATPPEALREAALIAGLRGLAGVTACVLLIVAAVLIAVAIARASRIAPTLRVRRAVGASRRQLVAAEIAQGGILAVAAIVVGGASALPLARSALAAWPGTVGALPWDPTGPTLIGIAGCMVLATLLAVPMAGRVRPDAGAPVPVPLLVPMVLVAVCSVALATAGALDRPDERVVIPTGVNRVATTTDPDFAAVGAGLASPGLLTGLGMVDLATTDCGACFLSGIAVEWHPVRAVHHLASADTFSLLGLDLLAGRLFDAGDVAGGTPVAVVSHSLAARHFQQGQAVGRRILIGGEHPVWHTVIGVVSDRPPLVMGAADLPANAVYLSPKQHHAPTLDVLLAPDVPPPHGVTNVGPAMAVFAEATAPVRWLAERFRGAGALALVSALVGAVLVMGGWGRALTHDLGVRRAVGARRRHVLTWVLARVLITPVVGATLGLWLGPMLWGAFFPQFVTDIHGPVAAVPRIAMLLGAVMALSVVPTVRRALVKGPAEVLGSA